MDDVPDLLLNLSQVAQVLGVSYAQVYRMLNDEQLPFEIESGRRKVPLAAIAQRRPEGMGSLTVTIGQVAVVLSVRRADVLELTQNGTLPLVQVSRHRRYGLTDVLQLSRREMGTVNG